MFIDYEFMHDNQEYSAEIAIEFTRLSYCPVTLDCYGAPIVPDDFDYDFETIVTVYDEDGIMLLPSPEMLKTIDNYIDKNAWAWAWGEYERLKEDINHED